MGDQVGRFSPSTTAVGNPSVRQDDLGNWVRYSDYEKLVAERDFARKQRDYVQRCGSEWEHRAIDLEAERDQARERVEKLERALEEAEDRFESCDICERPSRKEDLKAVWVKDAESKEQADAQVCLVCRLESDRRSERELVLEEAQERLERDEALGWMAYELERLGWTLPPDGAQTAKDLRCALSDAFDHVLGEKERS